MRAGFATFKCLHCMPCLPSSTLFLAAWLQGQWQPAQRALALAPELVKTELAGDQICGGQHLYAFDRISLEVGCRCSGSQHDEIHFRSLRCHCR